MGRAHSDRPHKREGEGRRGGTDGGRQEGGMKGGEETGGDGRGGRGGKDGWMEGEGEKRRKGNEV